MELLLILNDLFVPLPVKKSWLFNPDSNMISKGSCAVNVESVSSMILSVVTSESSRVPDSCRTPPPTTLTNPVGNSTSVSADGLVKVKESLIWYPVPTSSMITPDTPPLLMVSTLTSANSFPVSSTTIGSSSS